MPYLSVIPHLTRNPEIPAKGYFLDFTFWTPHHGAG